MVPRPSPAHPPASVRPRRTSMRAPGGSSTVRRPSHQSTPAPSVWASTSTAIPDSGEQPSAARRGVRADRHHQQSLDRGPDDGAAGAEVVRRGARRRGTHDAVAAELAQRPVVDLDDHLEHPLSRSLLHARLVEGPAWSRRARGRGRRSRRGSSAPRWCSAGRRWRRSSCRRLRSRPRRGSRRGRGPPQQRGGGAVGELGARRMVPSPPITTASSHCSQAASRPAPSPRRRRDRGRAPWPRRRASGRGARWPPATVHGERHLARLLAAGVGHQQDASRVGPCHRG